MCFAVSSTRRGKGKGRASGARFTSAGVGERSGRGWGFKNAPRPREPTFTPATPPVLCNVYLPGSSSSLRHSAPLLCSSHMCSLITLVWKERREGQGVVDGGVCCDVCECPPLSPHPHLLPFPIPSLGGLIPFHRLLPFSSSQVTCPSPPDSLRTALGGPVSLRPLLPSHYSGSQTGAVGEGGGAGKRPARWREMNPSPCPGSH